MDARPPDAGTGSAPDRRGGQGGAIPESSRVVAGPACERLLDRSAGAFRIGPYDEMVPAARHYLPGSLVVDTTWQTRTGWLLVRDALARARFWVDHRAVALNDMQRRVLNKMLEAGPGQFDGGLTARKYMVIAGTTRVTASRHLADLLEKGLIVRAEGPSGRSTRYDPAIPGWEWRPPDPRSA